MKIQSDCWLWDGPRMKSGYAQVYDPALGRKELIHRRSYRLHKGPIPSNRIVCHTCDVRNCYNPDHLWLGTYKDNTQDGITKGRITLWNDAIRAKIPVKTHCKQGHEYTPENTAMVRYVLGEYRRCRTCNRNRARSKANSVA